MNFEKISNKLVEFFLIPLLIISICGSISLLPTLLQLVPNKAILCFIGLLILAYVVYSLLRVKEKFFRILNKIKKPLLIIFICITLIWQFMLVRALSGEFGWDPHTLICYVIGKSIAVHDKFYFSFYPNNFLLLVIEKIFKTVFFIKTPSKLIFALNILNIVIIDLSAYLLFVATKNLFNRKAAWCTLLFYWVLYIVWPFVVISYSDNWSILIGTLFLLIYSKNQNFNNFFLTLCFGIVTAFALLMKPSTVIFIIAMVITKSFFSLQRKRKIKVRKLFKIIVSFGLGFVILYSPVKTYQQYNNIVNIESDKKMPITHFIAMGMSGNGSYNANDVTKNINIKNPQKRNKYNIKLIRERLSQMGLGGYVKFLVQKQINNTADGAFGWANEGKYLYDPFVKNLNKIEKHIRILFMHKNANQNYLIADTNISGYKFFPQIVWVVALLFMLLASIGDSFETIQLLKYTIVGGFIFLLLFEGGRSRYLIQFLPYLFTLAGLGLNKLIILKSKS